MATTRNTTEEVIRLVAEATGDQDIIKLAGTMAELAKGSDAAAGQASALVEQLQKLATAADNIKQFTTLKASLAETATELAAAKDKLAGLQAEIAKTDAPAQQLQRSMEKAAAEVESLTRQQNLQQVALSKTGTALRTAGIDTGKLGDAYAKLQGEFADTQHQMEGVAAGADRVAKSTDKAGGSVDTLKHASEGAAESLKSIAIKFASVAVAAELVHKALEGGAEFFTSAIDGAKDLESAIAQAGATTGATAAQMEGLRHAAEDAAKTTAFSALDAANGLAELGRAGVSAADSIQQLPAVLSLAQAAGIGVADAVTLTVQTLAEFQLAATDAGRVADLLAKGAKSGGIGIAQLGQELADTAPLARQLGLDAGQTVAVLGALAEAGLRGKNATAGLKDVFSQLADPTSAFSEQLVNLGIRTRDFNEVIVQLAAKGHDGEKALLSLSANARPAIQALVEDGGARIRQLRADLAGAAGSAATTAAAMGDTLAGGFNSISKSYEALKESLVQPLLEPLKNELRSLSEELDRFAQSPDFASIRASLGEIFVDGIKGLEEFLKGIDFHKLAGEIKDFAEHASTQISDFTEKVGAIIPVVEAVYNAFAFAFHAIETVVFALAAAVSEVVAAIADVLGDIQKLASFGPLGLAEKLGLTPDIAQRLHDFSDGMTAVADGFDQHMAGAASNAADSFAALEDAVAAAGDASSKSLGKTAAAADTAAQAAAGVADAAQQAAAGLDATAAAADTAATAQDRAAQATADLDGALHRLGVTTQADLAAKAAAASTDFNALVQAFSAGKVQIEDLRAGFVKYADAQRAAVANSDAWKKSSVEDHLAVQAAVLNLSDSFDKMGATGVRAGNDVAAGADHARGALTQATQAADAAASSVDSFGIHAERAAAQSADAAPKFHESAVGLIAMSDAAIQALQSLNKYAGQQDIWLHQFNGTMQAIKAQRGAVTDLNDALDAQLAKFDPLADKLAALKAQYQFVDDATLRALAAKQKQVEDQTKQAQEERARAAAAAQQAQAQQTAAEDAAARAASAQGPSRAVGSTASQAPGEQSPQGSAAALPTSAPLVPRAVGGAGVLATLRVEVVGGDQVDLLVEEGSARNLIDVLARSRAVSQRKR